ncbi:hypothetical protein [Hymenobacter glacieicola]|uniref:Glycosyltransferase RgtA/B/C/D-like domain-containing protein n=1 Tax=Hymenobacter glacieicola TaxID=1562124 RepID=A0ABQ1WGN2_9BACT|nr:hypothetical protein [Hymenobacter glacieicola]GGG28721.1 hypothetical protein GCM10011378_01870 [Hymenobacter glacieicola]
MTTSLRRRLRRAAYCTGLILLATVSFLFSPAPRTEAEYCGTYLHLTSFAGFTANCDGFVYMEDARHPRHLLEPKEVRQSRPLFILLGTAVGYPCTWLVEALSASGLLPQQVIQHLPAKYQPLLGFYIGYVLLNYVVLLASMLLFAHLYYRLTDGQGNRLLLGAMLVFFASNQVTKAFFWTVHQQMFTFLVPLFCAWLLLEPTRPPLRQGRHVAAWACLTGLLALVYGSFVLVLPCLLYGFWQQNRTRRPAHLLGGCLAVVVLFLMPTLLWIGLLRVQDVTYYNHEAEAYHQLIWLLDAFRRPWPEFTRLVAENGYRFLETLPAVGLVAGLVLGVLGLGRYHQWPVRRQALTVVVGLLGLFAGFFAVLGYYQPRLTFILAPLLLCLVVVLLPPRPPRWLAWALVGVALSWHVWHVVSYGPFS